MKIFIKFLLLLFVIQAFTVRAQQSSSKYSLIGSIGNAPSFNYPLDENNEYTFDQNANGSVVLKVLEILGPDQRLYYGAQGGDKSPLNGTVTAVSSENINDVGMFYFIMEENKSYKITWRPENNQLILTVTGTPDYFIIYATTPADNMEYPLYRTELNPDIPEDIKNGHIQSIYITSYDPFLIDREARAFQKTFSEDNDRNAVSNWDNIFKEEFDAKGGEIINDVSWIKDSHNYTDGNYIYQMTVSVRLNETTTRRYTSYANFTVNSSGNPLVVRPYYLVQIGESGQIKEYYTLTEEANPIAYYVQDGVVIMGRSGKIAFERPQFEEGTVIDYGDETRYKFTHKVLLRSNIPDIPASHIIGYRLYRAEVDEDNITGTTPLKDTTTDDGANAIYDDGRFMAIVDCERIQDYKYVLQLDFVDNDRQTQTFTSDPVIFCITVPSPKDIDAGVEFFKGSDINADTDGDKQNFRYDTGFSLTTSNGVTTPQTFPLNGVRYHNLREKVQLDRPNVTDELGAMMQDENSGGFTYYSVVMVGDEETQREQLRITNNGWGVTSSLLIPSVLWEDENNNIFDKKVIIYESSYPKTYNRMGNLQIDPITLTTDAPCEDNIDGVACIENSNVYFAGANGRTLMEKFDVKINFSHASVDNTLTYTPLNSQKVEKGTEGSLNETLMHLTDDDFYYVAIIDKTNIADDGSYVPSQLLASNRASYAHGVYTGAQLKEGIKFDFEYSHGGANPNEVFDLEAEKRYCNRLQLLISYLYVFNTNPAYLNENQALSDSPQLLLFDPDTNGSIIKSKAARFDLQATNLTTGIEDVTVSDADDFSIKKGSITLNCDDGEIYRPDGVLLARGRGVYNVNSGLYIIRHKDRSFKVFVE